MILSSTGQSQVFFSFVTLVDGNDEQDSNDEDEIAKQKQQLDTPRKVFLLTAEKSNKMYPCCVIVIGVYGV